MELLLLLIVLLLFQEWVIIEIFTNHNYRRSNSKVLFVLNAVTTVTVVKHKFRLRSSAVPATEGDKSVYVINTLERDTSRVGAP